VGRQHCSTPQVRRLIDRLDQKFLGAEQDSSRRWSTIEITMTGILAVEDWFFNCNRISHPLVGFINRSRVMASGCKRRQLLARVVVHRTHHFVPGGGKVRFDELRGKSIILHD